jgi:hypothetical protein
LIVVENKAPKAALMLAEEPWEVDQLDESKVAVNLIKPPMVMRFT